MLVLTRKPGKSLLLKVAGVEIKVKIADVSGRQVKLAVDAPQDVTILREEVQDRTAVPVPAHV